MAERQPIEHGRVVYTPSPAQFPADTPPGLRDFLVEKPITGRIVRGRASGPTLQSRQGR